MPIDLIGLDADDTLWQNEIHYRKGRKAFDAILRKYGITAVEQSRLHAVEIGNLEYYGYGAVGFAVSLAEAAVELTAGQVSADDLMRLLSISKDILSAEVELFEGAAMAVNTLAETHKLMLITKGDTRHQASKIERSGLQPSFDFVEIVAEKSPEVYAEILAKAAVPPGGFLMVGNAMKSDILPVLEIGGSAVYIHNELTWTFENAQPFSEASDRFFELDSIADLPELIRKLQT